VNKKQEEYDNKCLRMTQLHEQYIHTKTLLACI